MADVGEFGLIGRLAEILGEPTSPDVLVGIGDDAAVWRPRTGSLTVATTDALVEGVHFDLATTSWTDLGWKALAENVSDVAAMGCHPRYALVALALPGGAPVDGVEAFYRGMHACATRFGCTIVGGDVVRTAALTIQITLVGESMPVADATDRPLLERSRAAVGDALAVTGPLGGSAGGLQLLLGAAPIDGSATADALIAAHRRPMPRVEAGLALVGAGVRCAMDVSDGLLADVGHICERSGVDAEVDARLVPLYPGLDAIFSERALDLALTGGEDYELVCAAPDATIKRANALLGEGGQEPLTMIGRIVARSGDKPSVRTRTAQGALVEWGAGGWDHFRAENHD
jgi:thiamine-monophosphate kinase